MALQHSIHPVGVSHDGGIEIFLADNSIGFGIQRGDNHANLLAYLHHVDFALGHGKLSLDLRDVQQLAYALTRQQTHTFLGLA